MAQNDFSDNFDKMQRDAINRVREMQRRAQIPNSPAHSVFANPPHEENGSPEKSGMPERGDSLLSLFKGIHIDEEKALIGLLIYVLYKNGADTKLLLALGYLIL